MKRILCAAILPLCAVALAEEAAGPARGSPPKRVDLFPRLRAGEVFHYKIVSHAVTSADTQSVIVDPTAQGRSEVTVEALLRIEVLSVQPQGTRATIRLRTTWEQLESSPQARVPVPEGANETQRGGLEGKSIEFMLQPDGKVSDVSGLDKLSPEQQKAWRDWASQVSLASAYTEKGIRQGQKWKSEEAAEGPAAVKGLIWRRESAYVRDEPCRAMQLTLQQGPAEGSGEPETCAVLLTTARLEQKSSPKDATPEEYRRHDLRTSGRVQGTSETISYVSLTSGLVVRLTETGQQSLDITIAKADGSNKVHYKAEAKSHSQYLLVVGSPLAQP